MNNPVTYFWCFLVIAAGVGAADADDRVEFFESRIRPVLIEHCYTCHSVDAKNIRGGLLLDSSEAMRAGGDSGAAVVPGDPSESLVVSALKHESYEMPPDRKLPDDVIADFEQWIRDGAVDPRTGGQVVRRQAIDLAEGRKFWSFQPVRRTTPPSTEGDWARTEVDQFIAAGHQTAELTPAKDAAAHEVLRRLYFDLIGLPPAADEILAFEADWKVDSDKAVESVVDQLLASPHFGERWGRHWLDVTRFAESSGGGRSLMFPEAWRFRDYVIRAFNNDKPFDQLTREHIAGDLLPWKNTAQHDDQVTGVGYLALGPTNYEQQDKELLRMEVVDEQIDSLGRTFLGLTIGCARCHDHKFDPIPTADYYGLAGIFRSTQTLLPGNVSTYVTTSLKNGFDAEQLEQWKTTEATLKARIRQLQKKLKISPATHLAGVDTAALPGIVVDDAEAVFTGRWKASTSVPVYVGSGYQHDEQMKNGRRVHFAARLPSTGRYHVRFAYSPSQNRCVRLPIMVHHAAGDTVVTIDQRKRPNVDGLFTELGVFEFDAATAAAVSVNSEEAGAGVVIVDAVQFLPVDAAAPPVSQTETSQQMQVLSEQLQKLESALKKHAALKPQQPVAMGVRDEAEPADWHIHIRGGIRNLGPIVPRGFISAATPPDETGGVPPARLSPQESGRRELAEWLASPDNPLTARVFVNRVWQHLIGEGLVRTPDSFGRTGQQPSHPELLDYLAATFMEEDAWSVKSLIRRIATSRVYRLSSTRPAGQAVSDNRLLTHAFRRRLEAEALRDAILSISGQLDTSTVGGRTIQKLSQYDNGYDHETYSRNLRSVYVPFFRNSMLEFLDVFDIANPNLVTGRRTTGTLPSQALYLLNSPFVLQQSEFASENFLETESSDPGALNGMIERVCLQTLGRRPAPAEIEFLSDFVTSNGSDSVAAWTGVFQALFASVDFRYLD